jgi:ferrous iron transport protein B
MIIHACSSCPPTERVAGTTFSVALAGNPNTGKTSLFNALTGENRKVGNWPGVTVDLAVGSFPDVAGDIRVVDLPGTYSLGAASPDERVATEFLLSRRADIAAIVLDASNLERSLYLAVQVLELDLPALLVVNMGDLAVSRGMDVDLDALSRRFGVPVVSTLARGDCARCLPRATCAGCMSPRCLPRGSGVDSLRKAFRGAAAQPRKGVRVPYGADVARAHERIESALSSAPADAVTAFGGARILAIRLAERDPMAMDHLAALSPDGAVARILAEEDAAMTERFGYGLDTATIERRWRFVSEAAAAVVAKGRVYRERLSVTDRIDRVVTSPFVGLLIFLAATWGVFKITYLLGDPMAHVLGAGVQWAGGFLLALLERAGAPAILSSLVSDGIIGGVGSVLVFVPQIMLLFAAVAMLEESGYMARGVFVMDRIMAMVGLHGKSFIPMIMGFGCNVPAIAATRILDNPRDRLLTLMVIPFMSCSARLPVYILFAGAFYGDDAPTVVFSLYVLGVVVAVAAAKLLGGTLFRGEPHDLFIELPPYQMPSLRNVARAASESGIMFLRKAGTWILGGVVIMWAMANLPPGTPYAGEESLVGRLGHLMAPVLAPAGYGFWQAAVALVFGFFAKEVIVGTFGTLLGVSEVGLEQALARFFTPLSAYSFLVMTLLYVPCVAAVAATYAETKSVRWTAFMVFFTVFVGYVGSVVVFQAGRLLLSVPG